MGRRFRGYVPPRGGFVKSFFRFVKKLFWFILILLVLAFFIWLSYIGLQKLFNVF